MEVIQTRNLTKSYSGTVVLDGVNVSLKEGEVHVFFGENGAGKSTLISILAGANHPTSGVILFQGQEVKFDDVRDARQLGISAVFQEFSLIPQMTVEENLFLGAEREHCRGGIFLKKEELHKQALEIIDTLDFHINPSVRVDQLTRAEQQMVEIAKAFRSELKVLILDEPTASLTNHETNQLFKLIEKVKSQGVGVIYITHRMSEIREIGDRITVLRDGKYVDTVDAKTTSQDKLVQLMTGRTFDKIFPVISSQPKEKILEVTGLTNENKTVNNIDFYVRRGEILGFAGLVGSGKSELMQSCFGVDEITSGTVVFKDQDVTRKKISAKLKAGFLYLPSDRRVEGLMMMRSARENMSLPALCNKEFLYGPLGLLNTKYESQKSQLLANQLTLSPNRIEQTVDFFSGGNQQKVMLARSLNQKFDLIVFDEPTVGVDIGTRVIIYEFIAELCNQGVGIVLISSDLPEILNLTHRTYVFYRGKIQKELIGTDITEEKVLSYFFKEGAA